MREHPSHTAYIKDGCRCEPCVLWWREKGRAYYQANRERERARLYANSTAGMPCAVCGVEPRVGRQTTCTPCGTERTRASRAKKDRHSRQAKLKVYGLTLEDFDRMVGEQGNACAICGRDGGVGGADFHVDHCHASGVVRGLLCGKCNLGIGLLGDDAEVVARAAAYLAAFGTVA